MRDKDIRSPAKINGYLPAGAVSAYFLNTFKLSVGEMGGYCYNTLLKFKQDCEL